MTFSPWLGYTLGAASIGVISRLWVRFRRDRKGRRAYATTLFSPSLLDAVLKPIAGDEAATDDDPNVLAELHSTLSHLNRRSYAEEFWNVHEQLSAYYYRIPQSSRPTMRRALVRMIATDCRWLQLAAAKSAAQLEIAETAPVLRTALEPSSLVPQAKADERFLRELEGVLRQIEETTAVSSPDISSKSS